MNPRIATLAITAAVMTGCGTPPPSRPTCFTFGPPLHLGATYGPPLAPGTTILSQGSLSLSIEPFVQSSGTTSFNQAAVSVPPFGGNGGQMLRANNINFKIKPLGAASLVTLNYVDMGGSENFSVNGGALSAGDISSLPTVVNGVSTAVKQAPLFNSGGARVGSSGKLQLKGQISEFVIGGQEFWIDNVCVTR